LTEDGRKGAAKACPHAFTKEEKTTFLDKANTPEYRDLAPAVVVAKLADEGSYLGSESTLYRILKSEEQLKHRTNSSPRRRTRPDALIATAPNRVWTWDITYLKSVVRGQYFYLYLHIDIFSRKIVGWSVHERESEVYAAELFKRLCAAEDVNPLSLRLHSDNGSPMKGSTMLATLQALGVVPSFSRPSVSNDNPYSEALFKTLKYSRRFPDRPFETLESAQEWVSEFVRWYNDVHLHSGISFVTPADRHAGRDEEVLRRRRAVYAAAKQRAPRRWSGEAREWKREDVVTLNSERSDSRKQG
jgi:putative transposase